LSGTVGTTKRQVTVGQDTVETVVRHQLAEALGGRRGMLEAAVPTLGFTLTYLPTRELELALGVGLTAAVVLLGIRLVQRSSPQFVLNSIVGIGIAAVFALRSGKAEDVFLPGILWNAATASLMILSIVTRWPLVGFMIGSVTGDPTGWRRDPAVVRLCTRLTWLLVLPNLVRLSVQYPLYLAGEVGWLGATKLALGWPLQVGALAAMVWLLARGHTPLAASPEVTAERLGGDHPGPHLHPHHGHEAHEHEDAKPE
jgi:hypothetical protein